MYMYLRTDSQVDVRWGRKPVLPSCSQVWRWCNHYVIILWSCQTELYISTSKYTSTSFGLFEVMTAMHWRQAARRLTGGFGRGEKLKKKIFKIASSIFTCIIIMYCTKVIFTFEWCWNTVMWLDVGRRPVTNHVWASRSQAWQSLSLVQLVDLDLDL